MKIIYIADPNSVHTQRWVKAFQNKGHDVSVISFAPLVNTDNSIPVYSVWSDIPKLRIFTGIIKAREYVKRNKPDIIHIHYLNLPSFFSCVGFSPMIKLVITGWGNDILIDPFVPGLYKSLFSYMLNSASLITADAQTSVDIIKNNLRDKSKAHLIQWGVNLGNFSPANNDEKRNIRGALGLPDKFTVLSQRSHQQFYNIDMIIKGFSMAAHELPDIQMVVLADGPETENLKQLAKELGVQDKVYFTGQLKYSELPPYVRAGDIAVSVPANDATAMSVLEAMACGLGIIASDLPANKEWVDRYIISPTPAEISKYIIKYYNLSDHEKDYIGRRNTDMITKHANHAKEMDKMNKLYEGLCAE